MIDPNHFKLIDAACRGDCRTVQQLATDQPELLHIRTRDKGRTLLHQAVDVDRVGSQNVQVVRLLLEHKAPLAAQDWLGWTPLHCAAFKGHVSLVSVLCDAQVDIDSQNHNGKTPLSLVAGNNSPLDQHVAVVKMLLSRKADPDVFDTKGWTALHSATQNAAKIENPVIRGRAIQVIWYLLQAGASPYKRIMGVKSPFLIAILSRQSDIVFDFLVYTQKEAIRHHLSNDETNKCSYSASITDYRYMLKVAKEKQYQKIVSWLELFNNSTNEIVYRLGMSETYYYDRMLGLLSLFNITGKDT